MLPGSFVMQLFTARDGTLWICTGTGLASWDGAKLTRYAEFDGKQVRADSGGSWRGTVGWHPWKARPAGSAGCAAANSLLRGGRLFRHRCPFSL